MEKLEQNIVWYHRDHYLPPDGRRILVMSPKYHHKDPFKIRLIDSQFFSISSDAEWWAFIDFPKLKL